MADRGEKMLKFFFAVVLFLAVDAYKDRVPVEDESVCSDMVLTGHGDSNVTGPAPYKIGIDGVGDLESYLVTLYAKGNATFKGFFIQARPWDLDNHHELEANSLGMFEEADFNTEILGCFDAKDNVLGHNNNNTKNHISAIWKRSSNKNANIRFRAAVVMGPSQVYWRDVYSDGVISAIESTGVISRSSMAVIIVCIFIALIKV